MKLAFDSGQGWYDVWVDGEKVKAQVELTIKAGTLERMVFRTGSWRGDVRLMFLDGERAPPGWMPRICQPPARRSPKVCSGSTM